MNLLKGDCLELIKTLPDNSVDSIVSDPPYELSFMGKGWDGSGIAYSVKLWQECLRVLKPGGHLLAFGGTRTYHRMAVAIEDAGFEIRDSIHWTYGSGFPKSLNLKDEWAGWGTALKPSHEPIVVARKPLAETVAANVLEWGTGALNIDGTRVGTEGGTARDGKATKPNDSGWTNMKGHDIQQLNAGRWPANTVITHNPDCDEACVEGCPAAALDEPAKFFTQTTYTEADTPAFLYYAKASKRERDAGLSEMPEQDWVQWQTGNGASGKPSSMSEGRNTVRRNTHPTVKPVELMRHLVRLVTPKGGTVLDPFLGSGTTAVAAVLEGCEWIGCEMTEDYWPIIEGRVAWAMQQPGTLL